MRCSPSLPADIQIANPERQLHDARQNQECEGARRDMGSVVNRGCDE